MGIERRGKEANIIVSHPASCAASAIPSSASGDESWADESWASRPQLPATSTTSDFNCDDLNHCPVKIALQVPLLLSDSMSSV